MLLLNLFLVLFSITWGGVQGTSNNLTDVVTWDKYSLLVEGSRVFV